MAFTFRALTFFSTSFTIGSVTAAMFYYDDEKGNFRFSHRHLHLAHCFSSPDRGSPVPLLVSKANSSSLMSSSSSVGNEAVLQNLSCKCVIVGGGYGGSKFAASVDSLFDVTLIDDKNYYEDTYGIMPMIGRKWARERRGNESLPVVQQQKEKDIEAQNNNEFSNLDEQHINTNESKSVKDVGTTGEKKTRAKCVLSSHDLINSIIKEREMQMIKNYRDQVAALHRFSLRYANVVTGRVVRVTDRPKDLSLIGSCAGGIYTSRTRGGSAHRNKKVEGGKIEANSNSSLEVGSSSHKNNDHNGNSESKKKMWKSDLEKGYRAEVILSDGRRVPYDLLILATGARRQSFPFYTTQKTLKGRLFELRAFNEFLHDAVNSNGNSKIQPGKTESQTSISNNTSGSKVEKSCEAKVDAKPRRKRIAVIGGGPAGVILAASLVSNNVKNLCDEALFKTLENMDRNRNDSENSEIQDLQRDPTENESPLIDEFAGFQVHLFHRHDLLLNHDIPFSNRAYCERILRNLHYFASRDYIDEMHDYSKEVFGPNFDEKQKKAVDFLRTKIVINPDLLQAMKNSGLVIHKNIDVDEVVGLGKKSIHLPMVRVEQNDPYGAIGGLLRQPVKGFTASLKGWLGLNDGGGGGLANDRLEKCATTVIEVPEKFSLMATYRSPGAHAYGEKTSRTGFSVDGGDVVERGNGGRRSIISYLYFGKRLPEWSKLKFLGADLESLSGGTVIDRDDKSIIGDGKENKEELLLRFDDFDYVFNMVGVTPQPILSEKSMERCFVTTTAPIAEQLLTTCSSTIPFQISPDGLSVTPPPSNSTQPYRAAANHINPLAKIKGTPSYSFFAVDENENILDSHVLYDGRYRISKLFQLQGHNNIFAIGKCNNLPYRVQSWIATDVQVAALVDIFLSFISPAPAPFVPAASKVIRDGPGNNTAGSSATPHKAVNILTRTFIPQENPDVRFPLVNDIKTDEVITHSLIADLANMRDAKIRPLDSRFQGVNIHAYTNPGSIIIPLGDMFACGSKPSVGAFSGVTAVKQLIEERAALINPLVFSPSFAEKVQGDFIWARVMSWLEQDITDVTDFVF